MTRRQLRDLYNYYLEHSLRRAGWGRQTIDDLAYARLSAAVLRHWTALEHVRKRLTTPEHIRAGAVHHLTLSPELAHYRGLIHRADTTH